MWIRLTVFLALNNFHSLMGKWVKLFSVLSEMYGWNVLSGMNAQYSIEAHALCSIHVDTLYAFILANLFIIHEINVLMLNKHHKCSTICSWFWFKYHQKFVNLCKVFSWKWNHFDPIDIGLETNNNCTVRAVHILNIISNVSFFFRRVLYVVCLIKRVGNIGTHTHTYKYSW